MKAPHKLRTLLNEDDPKERDRRLQQYTDQVADILDGGITVADNMAAFWREFEFDGPAASFSVTVGLSKTPRAVLLAQLVNVTTAAGVALAFGWQFDAGRIVTTSFAGLPAARYRATLLVVKE
jgi:hypothetical protein